MTKLRELLNDHQIGMSKFQDDYFVTQKAGGTLYGQYKQALRELFSRFNILRDEFFNYEMKKVDVEKLRNDLETNKITNYYEKKKAELELWRQEIVLYEKSRQVDEIKREFFNFYRQAVHLKGLIGEITEERRNELEKDMFIWRTKASAAVDYIMTGRMSTETFSMITSFPKEIKYKLLEELKADNSEKISEWFINSNEYYIPDDLSHIPLPEDLSDQLLKIEYTPEKLIR